MNNWKKTFSIIWAGQIVSTLSSSIVGYAIVFWVSLETRSAEILAFSTIATLLPQLLLGPFTGALIDRWDRRKTMIISDLFIALCTLAISVMFYFNKIEVVYIYLLLILRSVGSAFHVPAMQSSIPLMAPESALMRIAGVNQVISSAGTIAGPAFAAVMVTTMNMSYILAFDILGAIIACTSLLFVTIPRPEKTSTEKPNIFREVKEGIDVIRSKPGILWLFILTVCVTFFIMPVSAMFPLMTLNHFEGNAYQMSLIEIVWGVGMLAGGAILGIKKFKIDKVVLVCSMYILLGLTFGISGMLSKESFIIFAVISALGGLFGAIYSGAFTVILQTNVDPSALGRVFSIYFSFTLIPAMVGLLATGFIADNIGITTAFIIAGISICFIGIVSFFIPAIRKMMTKV